MRWLAALCAVLTLGCSGDSGDSQPALDLLRTYATDGGAWTVTYVPSIDPIPQSQNFDLGVSVAGEGADGLTLTWDARMPLHGHGMNTQAVATGNADGTFDVTGLLFHMPGHWEMSGILTDGQVTETVIFDVQCCE